MFKTAYHHIRRSPYQAFAAIIIMMVTFFAVSIFAFLILGSSKVITYFESIPRVTAFFKNDAKQADIDALKSQLLATEKVESIKFVSKEDAFGIFKQKNKAKPLFMDLVTPDILPSSFEIATKQLSDLSGVATALTSSPLVDSVSFYQNAVPRLLSWTQAIRTIGIVVVVVLAFESLLIMTIIIGLKISQKREDIEIMRLIGATKLYISGPFLLEGMYYGAMGALLGSGIAIGALIYATPLLMKVLTEIPIFPISPLFFVELVCVELILGMVLGSISSWLTVNRYIK